jgi:hypothetical protein
VHDVEPSLRSDLSPFVSVDFDRAGQPQAGSLSWFNGLHRTGWKDLSIAVAAWVIAGPPPVKSHLTVKQAKARVD